MKPGVWTVGIDEVGRGPLAGPVAVGVFAITEGFDPTVLAGIRDSKKLSEHGREVWYERLVQLPHTRSAVAFTPASTIDVQGIQYAIRSALERALDTIDVPSSATLLLDGGLKADPRYTDQRTIIRGDVTEPLISAAAIIAKVTRDRIMRELDEQYPGYGFAKHKGYGTRAHCAALRSKGPCPIHRMSFITRLV